MYCDLDAGSGRMPDTNYDAHPPVGIVVSSTDNPSGLGAKLKCLQHRPTKVDYAQVGVDQLNLPAIFHHQIHNLPHIQSAGAQDVARDPAYEMHLRMENQNVGIAAFPSPLLANLTFYPPPYQSPMPGRWCGAAASIMNVVEFTASSSGFDSSPGITTRIGIDPALPSACNGDSDNCITPASFVSTVPHHVSQAITLDNAGASRSDASPGQQTEMNSFLPITTSNIGQDYIHPSISIPTTVPTDHKTMQNAPTASYFFFNGAHYHCQCGHGTRRRGDMIRHLESLRHSRQRKYMCSCGRWFTRKDALKRHKKSSCSRYVTEM